MNTVLVFRQHVGVTLKTIDVFQHVRAEGVGQKLGCARTTGTQTFRAAQRAWHEIAPGVDIKLLRPDGGGCMIALVRMAAGSTYSAHEHPLDESCLVLSGEIHIGAHCLRAGDLHVAAAGTTHAITFAPRGALLFVRTTRTEESFSD